MSSCSRCYRNARGWRKTCTQPTCELLQRLPLALSGFPFSLILMAAAVSVTPEPRAGPLLHQQGRKWFPLRAAAVPAISFPECLLVWNTYCLLKETRKKNNKNNHTSYKASAPHQGQVNVCEGQNRDRVLAQPWSLVIKGQKPSHFVMKMQSPRQTASQRFRLQARPSLILLVLPGVCNSHTRDF